MGEILWDVLPDSQHPGGAPFNFAFHAHHLGHEVCFVSAVGNDLLGTRAIQQMQQIGLSTRFLRITPEHPTGTVTVAFDGSGIPSYKIHRPAAYDFPLLRQEDFSALVNPAPDWIYFGTLQQMGPQAHELTLRLLNAAPTAKRFYDVNLRADSYTPQLVRELAQLSQIVKLSEEELPCMSEIVEIAGSSLEKFSRELARCFDLQAVCITRGAHGCALLLQDVFLEAPGFRVQVADTVGAGDAFSAAFIHGFHAGWPLRQIAEFSNRIGALVASRQGGTPQWTMEEAKALKLI